MAVNRDYSPQDFLGSTAPMQAAQTPSAAGSAGGEGGNTLLQGNIARTSGAFGRSATVKAGEDIRPALESLKSAGGGTLILLAGVHRPAYDIVGASKINIVGEGADQTIIDFGGSAYSIRYEGYYVLGPPEGIVEYPLENFFLSNFTAKNSASIGSIIIKYCNNFSLENVSASNNSINGFDMGFCKYYTLNNCRANENAQHGFRTAADLPVNYVTSRYFTFNNCIADKNVDSGFYFVCSGFSAAEDLSKFSLNNCTAIFTSGLGDKIGFAFVEADENVGTSVGATLVGCQTFFASPAILIEANISGVSCFGFSAGYSEGTRLIDRGGFNTYVGCDFYSASVSGPNSSFISTYVRDLTESGDAEILRGSNLGNTRASLIHRSDSVFMTNLTGSSIPVGSVVVLKATANADEIELTTTKGDDKVLGVLLPRWVGEDPLLNDRDTAVLLFGKTTILRADGTDDIAIGDFLCTHTVAGISAKAGAGDMAFAIALEAYTANDSSGVIDALLITPRKI